MASYSETTAIKIRHGNTSENNNFTGLNGEVVASLGSDGEGTDYATTLRLHNGINTGGIPLARADMANVTTDVLAKNRPLLGDKNLAYADMTNVDTVNLATGADEVDGHDGKNLAYADLSNIEELTESEEIETVKDLMHTYGLALNTQINELEEDKAEKDLSNVTLDTLANKGLAKTDMSNVSKATLTGKGLADTDMTNITTAGVDKIGTQLDNRFQNLSGRRSIIDPNAQDIGSTYPTVSAVANYIESAITQEGLMKSDLTNAKTWDPLLVGGNEHYDYISEITAKGTSFTETISFNGGADTIPTWAPTNYQISTTPVNLQLAVYSSGNESDIKPTVYRVYPEYGKTDLRSLTNITFEAPNNSQAVCTFTCKAVTGLSGIYWYHVTVTSVTGHSWENYKTLIDGTEVLPKYTNINNVNVLPVLMVNVKAVDSGKLDSIEFIPDYSETAISTPVNVTVAHPMLYTGSIQSGNQATIKLSTKDILPSIGGAGLLKNDLTNLAGMTDHEKAIAAYAPWNINPFSEMPSLTSPDIDEEEYYRLATVGQIWKALHEYGSTKVTIKEW